MASPDPTAKLLLDDPSTELSSNRTAMSFQRTRLSIDRTLMSVIRTALSLISFGFTINQFLSKVAEEHHPGADSARNFGGSLLALGVGLLIFGLAAHVSQIRELRARREELHALGLLQSGTRLRVSPSFVVAALLLILGLVTVFGMFVRQGPIQ